ncbi:MAG: recombinase family protein [Lachnospiraceae bacterium]|jgi:DNA invertase Pin-like site-specific DNA recombinase|nr:recombinase family protein [Lachnospiraceae bacterium]
MKHQIFGYARVSSKDQNASRQVEALRNYPVEEKNIYLEKKSGKDFNRPEYQRLLCTLQDGDILVIKSIDRLGRNYDETLEQWRVITKEKNVNVVVLDMPILNSYHHGDLTRKLISDIVLQLLSYVAQQEREFIHQRQTEGIAIAKANGVQFGPPKKQRGESYLLCLKLWEAGEISARCAADQLGVCHKTFLRWAREDGTAGYCSHHDESPR